MESLKKIINLVYFVDIDEDTRRRPVVDARRAYSKILKDAGYTLDYIGQTIGKNHTSVLHYTNTVESLLKYDSVFENKFILAKKGFLENHKNLRTNSREDIYAIAIDLEKRLFEITSKKQELTELLDNCKNEKERNKLIDYCRNIILPLLDN
jgi:hypothetical protein